MSSSNRDPTIWTDREISLLREALADHRNLWHARVLDLQLVTGLRPGEAQALRPADVAPDGWIRVVDGKTGDRTAYTLGGGSCPALHRWLDAADEQGFAPDERPYSWTHEAYWHALNRAASRIGLQEDTHDDQETWRHRIHPHAARSTWVRLAREHGWDWDLIAKLGWGDTRSLPTVQEHYYAIDLRRRLGGDDPSP